MSRMYSLPIEAIAQSAAKCTWQINAASDASVRIWRVEIQQEAQETSEQVGFQILRVTTAGTYTNAVTAVPLDSGDSAFGGTCSTLSTTDPTLSTVIIRVGFNVLAGWVWEAADERKTITVPGGGRIAGRFPTAPAAAVTLSGFVLFEEIN